MTSTTSGARPVNALVGRAARTSAVATLAVIGALHVAWGAGSAWPRASRADLSDAVLGSPGLQGDSAGACYAVAGALGAAAALVAGGPQALDRPRRVAVAGIAAILAARGALGLIGRTHLVSPPSTGERFRRLDRRVYAPLCLSLAGLTALSLGGHSGGSRPTRSDVGCQSTGCVSGASRSTGN
jgi:hypothetical protein